MNKDEKKETHPYTNSQIEAEAIQIVNQERQRWSDAVAFVTDRVAFQMRNLIRTLRKNYWGVYDVPVDPMTQRNKVWVPLTRTLVEGAVKGIDLDTKDINFRAKNEKGYAITRTIRALVKNFLDRIYFGEILDATERDLAIDGTVVWKTWKGEDGKLMRKTVDLLNVYIDPTEDNIQSAYRFTERSIALPSDIAAMNGWVNTEDLTGSTMISKIDGTYNPITTGTTASYRDLWETWGKIPKRLVTGVKEDDELIDGRIVVSGLESGNPKCHYIEENTTKDTDDNIIKPYEECRYAKVANRWYGLGVAERVLMLQIWLNTIVNIRINRSYVAQLGLFKIRKGSGITPQMLARLGANGAIVVNDPADLEQMQMDEASEASYTDESRIMDWAQRDTNIYDQSIGDATPASKPATTSVIENTSQKSGFKMVKDNIGSFLERWIDRHSLPIIADTVDVGDLIEISGDSKEIDGLIDSIVAVQANEELERLYEMKVVPTPEAMKLAMNAAKEKLLKKDNFFIKLTKKLIAKHVYTKVYVTNEELDPAVMVQNIMSMLQFVPPETQVQLAKEAMDLMGIDVEIPIPQPQPQQPPQMPQGAPQGAPQPGMMGAMMNNPQQQTTNANLTQ